MDLNLSPAEAAFRDEIRAWLADNAPQDWNKDYVARDMHGKFEYLRAWQRKCHEAGWAGVPWPKQFGGRGASLIEYSIFLEEMARASAPPFANVLAIGIIGPTIINYGTEAQKQRYLAKMLAAEEIWCQGFSEPEAGSDLAGVRSEARRDGDHFIVNAHKVWNSWGWAADYCALLTRTDASGPKHEGLTYLLVDMHAPGVTVRPLKQMTGESEFTELHFKDVRVPVENVLGKVGDGWKVAIGTLMHERSTYGARLSVTFKQQFERIVALAHEHGCADDPVIRQRLAQTYAEIEIFRLNNWRALSRTTQTGVPGPEGSILKVFWSELSQRMHQLMLEILGPWGQLTNQSPDAVDGGEWLYGYMRARGHTIAAGTSEIQRNIIGHNVLGLPKSY